MTGDVGTRILQRRAAAIRRNAIRIAAGRGQGYIGQALGTAEILSCLFFEIMDLSGPVQARDRFILSPGHYALAVYAVMAELEAYDLQELATYGMDGSRIEESPMEGLPGFEITGGSLAQGLSQGVGIALGKRLSGQPGRVFCLISDGELQEGQTWEAILSAAHHRLGNLVVVLDRNRRQVDGDTEQVSTLEPIPEKLAAFGIESRSVDGNDVGCVREGLDWACAEDRPRSLICETELGHGVSAFAGADYPHYIRTEAKAWDAALTSVTP
jgi:transketolase